MERIVITGMGAVTPLGLDAKSTWQAMCEGKSAVSTIRNWDSCALKVQIAAEVRDFDPTHYFSDKKLQTLDRFSQFAQVAAAQAIAQSGVELTVNYSSARRLLLVRAWVAKRLTMRN